MCRLGELQRVVTTQCRGLPPACEPVDELSSRLVVILVNPNADNKDDAIRKLISTDDVFREGASNSRLA